MLQSELFNNQMTEYYLSSYTHSGVTWLENCLVELGIFCDNQPANIFKFKCKLNEHQSEYELLPTAWISKVGLPSLTFKNQFIFRNDLYFNFMHAIPEPNQVKKVILIRDPRDTLFSRYKLSHADEMSFAEFAKNQIINWCEFYAACEKLPNAKFFRFEDYKKNPYAHLKNILEFCQISATDAEINNAVENSTSEKAKLAELVFLGAAPKEQRYFKGVFNRDGRTQQWKMQGEMQDAFELIKNAAHFFLEKYGYLYDEQRG